MNIRQNLALAALLLSLDQYAQFMQREIAEPSVGWHFCISRTPDGGELIGGSDSAVAVITKMNAVGHVQWAMRYPEVDDIIEIGTYPEGDHYALGMNLPDGVNPTELIILQLDTSGQVNWSRTWSPGSLMFASSGVSRVRQDANGDLMVTAYTYEDVYILRISRSGDTKWSVRYQTIPNDEIWGGISAVGRSTQAGTANTVYTAAIGVTDVGWGLWLLATDTLGQCLWDRLYMVPIPLLIFPWDLLVTSSNRLVIVGGMPEELGAAYNSFLAIADTLGNMPDPMLMIDVDSKRPLHQAFELVDGSLVVIGSHFFNGIPEDIVARYDTSGTCTWAVLGPQLFQSTYAIEPDGSFSSASGRSFIWTDSTSWMRLTRGNIYDQIACMDYPTTLPSTQITPIEASGHTQIAGPLPMPYAVAAVPFMPEELPYCGSVGVQPSPALPMLSIDPVPAADRITVEGWDAQDGSAVCTLFNARGEEMMQAPMASATNSFAVDVSALPPGLYLVVVNGEKDRWVGRCMIAR